MEFWIAMRRKDETRILLWLKRGQPLDLRRYPSRGWVYQDYLPLMSKAHQPSVRARIEGLSGPEVLVLLKVYCSVKYNYKLITSILHVPSLLNQHIYSLFSFKPITKCYSFKQVNDLNTSLNKVMLFNFFSSSFVHSIYPIVSSSQNASNPSPVVRVSKWMGTDNNP